jgi:hypothetical protein
MRSNCSDHFSGSEVRSDKDRSRSMTLKPLASSPFSASCGQQREHSLRHALRGLSALRRVRARRFHARYSRTASTSALLSLHANPDGGVFAKAFLSWEPRAGVPAHAGGWGGARRLQVAGRACTGSAKRPQPAPGSVPRGARPPSWRALRACPRLARALHAGIPHRYTGSRVAAYWRSRCGSCRGGGATARQLGSTVTGRLSARPRFWTGLRSTGSVRRCPLSETLPSDALQAAQLGSSSGNLHEAKRGHARAGSRVNVWSRSLQHGERPAQAQEKTDARRITAPPPGRG